MLRNEVKGEQLRDIRRVKRRDRDEKMFARSDGLRENAEATISCRDLDLPEKRKRYQSSKGEGRICTDVPLWKIIREQSSDSGRM